MINEDKFAKTIKDEELDEVAGGNINNMQKDIKFLNEFGAKLSPKATIREVTDA